MHIVIMQNVHGHIQTFAHTHTFVAHTPVQDKENKWRCVFDCWMFRPVLCSGGWDLWPTALPVRPQRSPEEGICLSVSMRACARAWVRARHRLYHGCLPRKVSVCLYLCVRACACVCVCECVRARWRMAKQVRVDIVNISINKRKFWHSCDK